MKAKVGMQKATEQKLVNIADGLRRFAGTPLARQLVYGLFLVQAVYLVFMIPIGVPPDELTHIRTIEQYVQQSHISPIITEQTLYSIGDLTRSTDYLYHYILSLVARALPFEGLALYVVFRLFSVLIVFLTLVTGARLIRRLGASQAVTTVGLLIVSNIAQVLFLSAAINQDQLVWLATALGALFLVRLWQRLSLVDVLVVVNVILFGAIVKKTFLPIAVLLGLLLLAIVIYKRSDFVGMLKKSSGQWKPAVITLGVVMLVGVGLNVERFGVNIVKYQQITVSCNKIHEHEQCLEYGVYRRNARLTGDKPADFTPTPISQFAPYWYYSNFRGVFGTQGWNGRALPADWAYYVMLGITTASLGVGAVYAARHRRRPETIIFVASLGYIAVQMFVNYSVYLAYAVQGLALQGRYIFPIIVPLVLVLTHVWDLALKQRPLTKVLLAAAVVVLLLTQSGLAVMLRSDIYTDNPLRPVIIFDPENAISPYEPHV